MIIKMGLRNFTLSVVFHFSSYGFFFSAFLAALSPDICEQEKFCSPHGPAIKFPFWLPDKQPEHCGYPGFNLYCDNSSRTVLELPSSVKLFVKHIIYKSHLIQLYDPEGCLPKQLGKFTASNNVSPVRFPKWRRFTFFNCSLANNQSTNRSRNVYGWFDVDCLDTPGYRIHGTYFDNEIRFLPLQLCTKMYTRWASKEMFERKNGIQLGWSLPECEKCERKGGNCTIRTGTKDEIHCNEKSSGTLLFQISSNRVQLFSFFSLWPSFL